MKNKNAIERLKSQGATEERAKQIVSYLNSIGFSSEYLTKEMTLSAIEQTLETLRNIRGK
jgi:hypothetical protein